MNKILILFFLLNQSFIKAQSIDSLFAKGNKYFFEENYDSAIINYDSIINLGFESEELYYNLGNCYYQKGNIPLSILNYEKSLAINPKQKHTINNLNIAKNRIKILEEIPELLIKKWWQNLIHFFSLNTWSVLLIIATWISSIFFYLFINSRSRFHFKTMIAFIFMSSFIYFTYDSKKNNELLDKIIFSNKAIVYSNPNLKSQKIVEIGQGNKAIVIKESGNWAFINLANGDKGWTQLDNLYKIKP
jgi:tetratricopeptide (TPR) repeat protein